MKVDELIVLLQILKKDCGNLEVKLGQISSPIVVYPVDKVVRDLYINSNFDEEVIITLYPALPSAQPQEKHHGTAT